MRATIAVLLIAMTGVALCDQPYHIETCAGTSEDLLHLDSYSIEGTIHKGNTVTLKAAGTVFQTVTIHSAYIKAYLGGIKVYTGTQVIDYAVTKGPTTINEPITIPSVLPKGKYKARIILKDAAGNQLQCFDANL